MSVSSLPSSLRSLFHRHIKQTWTIISGERAASVAFRAVSFASGYVACRAVDWTYDLISRIIHDNSWARILGNSLPRGAPVSVRYEYPSAR